MGTYDVAYIGFGNDPASVKKQNNQKCPPRAFVDSFRYHLPLNSLAPLLSTRAPCVKSAAVSQARLLFMDTFARHRDVTPRDLTANSTRK